MGLFSYTIAYQAANSEISRASEPWQSEVISGISGQILTPGTVFSKSDTSEIQSLAYNPVPKAYNPVPKAYNPVPKAYNPVPIILDNAQ